MTITSFKFLGFIIAALALYWVIPAKGRRWVLIAASILFYLSFSFAGIFVMIGTSLLAFGAGILIQKYKDGYSLWLSENKKTADKETRKSVKASYQKKQKLIAAAFIAVTVGILFMCKYYKVLAADISSIFDLKLWSAENILLPLGISYYSLQLIGYVVDVNRDIIPAEKNPLNVILYGGFFLSIMQGPFNRYNDLMPQICSDERKTLTLYQVRGALLRILGGYIKKLCIADQFGVYTAEVFNNYQNYSGLGILFGIFCFAVQLYADFSGYMDIVVGIGQLFGIKMPENFRQPFFSKNMSEFWKRWHITLGLWLQDYVFYPILKSALFKKMRDSLTKKFGKNAGRNIPTYIGMFILWVLIGAWHGAGFNYVFGVGILQFIYIFLGEIFEPVFKKIKALLKIDDNKLYWHVFQSLRCTALMMFAWVFFNSQSMGAALGMIKRLLAVPSLGQFLTVMYSGAVNGGFVRNFMLIAVGAVCVIAVDLLHEKGKTVSGIISRTPYAVRLAFYLVLIFGLIIFGAYGDQYIASNFIYFEF